MTYSQKSELLVQTLLHASPNEILNSMALSSGKNEDTYEIILRYEGSFSSIETAFPASKPTRLLGNYGILRLTKEEINALLTLPNVIYVEKTKELFPDLQTSKVASCIYKTYSPATSNPTSLTGQGVLLAIIDSGIDYMHPDFITVQGSTRILSLWDQTLPASTENPPPPGYFLGSLFTEETINRAIKSATTEERMRICPSVDLSGHGTHVAGIAAGNGRASSGTYLGVAPDAKLLVVKLGFSSSSASPNTTGLMQAINFCIEKSLALSMPLVINLSYGNTYGSHTGSSLLETYINQVSNLGRCSIVVGSGNEASSAGHAAGQVSARVRQDFSIAPLQKNFSLQLWKYYSDEYYLLMDSPSASLGPIPLNQGPDFLRFSLGNTKLLLSIGEPSPYSIFQEIYFDFIPAGQYLDEGIWSLSLLPQKVRSGSYELWMPSTLSRGASTQFLRPTLDKTLTIPSTASHVITVGAYDANTDTLAAFSGCGSPTSPDAIKPDLVAPGVSITAPAPGGGYLARTGTSMAAPFVSGAACCLMEWGIIKGNDPYLYGEKLKAYLHRGARPLPAYKNTPNPKTGWGALCLSNSLPTA